MFFNTKAVLAVVFSALYVQAAPNAARAFGGDGNGLLAFVLYGTETGPNRHNLSPQCRLRSLWLDKLGRRLCRSCLPCSLRYFPVSRLSFRLRFGDFTDYVPVALH
jgi:hypothetical protein